MKNVHPATSGRFHHQIFSILIVFEWTTWAISSIANRLALGTRKWARNGDRKKRGRGTFNNMEGHRTNTGICPIAISWNRWTWYCNDYGLLRAFWAPNMHLITPKLHIYHFGNNTWFNILSISPVSLPSFTASWILLPLWLGVALTSSSQASAWLPPMFYHCAHHCVEGKVRQCWRKEEDTNLCCGRRSHCCSQNGTLI